MEDSRNTLVLEQSCIFTTETHICRSPWVGAVLQIRWPRSPWSIREHAGKCRKQTEQFAEPGFKKVWNTGLDITIILAVQLDGSVLHYTFSLCFKNLIAVTYGSTALPSELSCQAPQRLIARLKKATLGSEAHPG